MKALVYLFTFKQIGHAINVIRPEQTSIDEADRFINKEVSYD